MENIFKLSPWKLSWTSLTLCIRSKELQMNEWKKYWVQNWERQVLKNKFTFHFSTLHLFAQWLINCRKSSLVILFKEISITVLKGNVRTSISLMYFFINPNPSSIDIKSGLYGAVQTRWILHCFKNSPTFELLYTTALPNTKILPGFWLSLDNRPCSPNSSESSDVTLQRKSPKITQLVLVRLYNCSSTGCVCCWLQHPYFHYWSVLSWLPWGE